MKSAVHLQKVLVILTVIAAVVLIIFYQETFKNSTFLSYRPSRKNKMTNKFRGNIKDARSQLDIKVLFVGVKKCGTSTLKTFFSQHPSVLVTNKPHVCRPKPFSSYRPILDAQQVAEETGKVLIVENNECFHNIKYFDRMKKAEKIILLLCDPTLRAYSDYKHIVRTYSYRQSFLEIVRNAINAIQSYNKTKHFDRYLSNFRYHGHLDYSIVSVGFYYEYLKEFYKRYNPRNILILSGTQLKENPSVVMNQLETFLGLPQFFNSSMFVKHPLTGFYCVQRTPEVRPKCLGISQNRNFLPPAKKSTEMLQKLYKPYNEKLFKMINQTFMWT